MLLFLVFQWFVWIYSINSETILHSPSSDYTLSLSNSPYIVNSYVTFGSTANITIENGVKIIFIDHYFISVFGNLNCGCNDASSQNNNIRGLSNPFTFTHIYGNSSMPTSTGIFINQQNSVNAPIITFCNTLFDNIQNGIVTTSQQYNSYTVHNCEFQYINNAIHHSNDAINYVYNSYFHDINNVKSGGGVIYDNCMFHSFGKFSFNTEKAINIGIRNSEIYGDGVQICLNINSVAGDPLFAVYNNTIRDCMDGIEIWSAISIQNNTISNCTRYGISAVDIIDDIFDITYNVFEHNGVFDVYLNNIFSVNIIENVFMPQTGYNSSVYAIDSNVYIYRNVFESLLNYDYILEIEQCDIVDIKYNIFMNNNIYDLIRLNDIININISYNILDGNSGKYSIIIENDDNNGNYVYITHNNISNNEISEDIMNTNGIDNVEIISNYVMLNVGRKLISIQNANHAIVSDNILENNYIENVVYSEYNNDILIKYNQFESNNAYDNDNTANIVYISRNINAYIGHNIFQNGVNIESMIDFQSIDITDIGIIEYNDFMTDNDNIHQYIHCNAYGFDDYQSKISISAHFNNFYNTHNVEYIVSTIDININANNNYFSDLITYNDIKTHISDICDDNNNTNDTDNGFVNVSTISETPIINNINNSQCFWNIINCDLIRNYHCDSNTISPSVSPTIYPILYGDGIYIEATHRDSNSFPDNIESTIDLLLSFDIESDTKYASNYILMILGSIGITLIFAVFSGILMYIFFKLKKLKEETKHLNKQIREHKRISLGLDAIERAVFGADSNINKHKQQQKMKESAQNANNDDEKNDTESGYEKEIPRDGDIDIDIDNSSLMYCSHHFDEIEGNETGALHYYNDDEDEDDNYAFDANHLIMNAINTEMTEYGHGTGELSMQMSHSALPHHLKSHSALKDGGHFALKIDIGLMVDGIDFGRSNSTLSELISEDETSLSSASFTVQTQDESENSEHKIDNGYIGLMSPTNTTKPTSTPPTPQMDPDQILHALNFRNKHLQQHNGDPNTPPGHSIAKIAKSITKAQWM